MGKSEKFFHVILNSIADGVFTIDKEAKITFLNKAAEDITGFSNREAIGHRCFDIFRADICQSRCALKETLRTKKEIINLPATILRKGGKKIPISISTAVLRNEAGEIVGGVETFRDLSAIEELKKELSQKYSLGDIISKNHLIHDIFNILPNVAESDSTVLIQGASGTGKELLAKAIHHLSHRKEKRFVKVNCGALPDTLLESELFGYVKGAFTDAKRDKPGRFALADGGTIFLDEVGDMSASLQVKLLRVLQEKEYEPLGSASPRKTDVRIIAATNKDLLRLVNEKSFRDDLFYRLNVVKIELPPLSERREDIPLLINAFIQKFNAKMGRQIVGTSDQAFRFLLTYDYPGNVRELENIIEHAFVLCRGDRIDVDCLPQSLPVDREQVKLRVYPVKTGQARQEPLSNLPVNSGGMPREEAPFGRAEAEVVKTTLRKYGGNRMKVARELGISRATLWRKMKRYGLHDGTPRT
jgi:PAS domain S-box-containing protein